jgi:hypothetical protein
LNVTTVFSGNLPSATPSVSCALVDGSNPYVPSLYAATCARTVCVTAGTRTLLYVPSTAMPAEPVLKPYVCAPIRALSTPPRRPSNRVPHLSTRKL